MNSLRIGLVGLAAALAGFVLQGCFDAQPPPQCQVTAGNIVSSITNYMMVLTKTSSTGPACPDMPSMEVGLERFQPLDGGFTLGARPARLVDMAMGKVFTGDIDKTNDCTKPDTNLPDPCMTCQPSAFPPPPNSCKITVEAVKRVDPADPTGAGLAGIAPFPINPVDGVCPVPELTVSQNFAAVPVYLADGGRGELPALPTSLKFIDLKVMMTASVPGIAFTSKLHYEEGANCTADYDALGVWPIVTCSTDSDCDPSPDYDAGRTSGSGITASWEPKCRTDLGICVPTVDLTTLK